MLKKNQGFSNHLTNKLAKEYLPRILSEITNNHLMNPNQISEYWNEIIGTKLLHLTKVQTFKNKTLYVLVNSSTLFSILNVHEKKRLLKLMQDKFSEKIIKNIIFKIG